jgi:hypothetical protein
MRRKTEVLGFKNFAVFYFIFISLSPRIQFWESAAGLPDFFWYMIPKPEKMYQTNAKCT